MKKLLFLAVAALLCLSLCACDGSNYEKATALYESGEYEKAATMFAKLGDYENSAEMVNVCKYTYAAELLEAKDYEKAKAIFTELGDYEDSVNFLKECSYREAEGLFEEGKFEEALSLYENISDYEDTQDKIVAAKKEIMLLNFGDVIKLMNARTWFYNGGSDKVVNRITFADDGTAKIVQMYSDGNGPHSSAANDVSYVMDAENITLILADGSQQNIAYAVENDTITLGGGYLTPAEVEADLQGYWRDRKEESIILGISFGGSEYICYFNNGKIESEYASEKYGGKNGEYYYYGPYTGTYTVDDTGLHANIRDGEYSFGIIDGKAVVLRYDSVCSPTIGFKGKYGFSF